MNNTSGDLPASVDTGIAILPRYVPRAIRTLTSAHAIRRLVVRAVSDTRVRRRRI